MALPGSVAAASVVLAAVAVALAAGVVALAAVAPPAVGRG